MNPQVRMLTTALGIALPWAPLHASADDTALQALVERLERLEQRLGAPPASRADDVADLQSRLAILERKLEIQAEEVAAKAPTTPAVAINEKGLAVKTPKGDFDLKLRGTVQFDQRWFFDDDAAPINDTQGFRRLRPSLEGTLTPLLTYRITPELAGDSASVVDAYLDVRFDPRYTLRAGKVKGPVGLERLQSASAISMTERGFATELAPNRDIGVQLQGEIFAGRAQYVIGLYNGAADGRDAPSQDADNHQEWAGRVFFEPWRNSANALSGLGFGIAASIGDKQGAGNNFLPRYRSPGQNVFFNYRSTVLANGEHRRLSPQAYYYRNRLGLLGEYIRSEQALTLSNNPAAHASLQNDAWQLTASWVLTGEDASYKGIAKPDQPFTLGAPGWGAFELVARYGELDVDDDAFPLYASADASTTEARAWGIGLNWYLTSNLKLVVNHARARFSGGASGARDRPDEKTLLTRLQVAF